MFTKNPIRSFMFASLILFATSCSNNLDIDKCVEIENDISPIINDGEDLTFNITISYPEIDSSLAKYAIGDYNCQIPKPHGVTLRSQHGPYSVQANKTEYIQDFKIGMYNVPDYPNLYGYYVTRIYKYYTEIIIPSKATMIIPQIIEQDMTHMGYVQPIPNQNKNYGYGIRLKQSSDTYDIYEIYTYVWQIYANTSGQFVGPYFYPKEVKNPSLISFKYVWNDAIVW